jgi:hypothetical protein
VPVPDWVLHIPRGQNLAHTSRPSLENLPFALQNPCECRTERHLGISHLRHPKNEIRPGGNVAIPKPSRPPRCPTSWWPDCQRPRPPRKAAAPPPPTTAPPAESRASPDSEINFFRLVDSASQQPAQIRACHHRWRYFLIGPTSSCARASTWRLWPPSFAGTLGSDHLNPSPADKPPIEDIARPYEPHRADHPHPIRDAPLAF